MVQELTLTLPNPCFKELNHVKSCIELNPSWGQNNPPFHKISYRTALDIFGGFPILMPHSGDRLWFEKLFASQQLYPTCIARPQPILSSPLLWPHQTATTYCTTRRRRKGSGRTPPPPPSRAEWPPYLSSAIGEPHSEVSPHLKEGGEFGANFRRGGIHLPDIDVYDRPRKYYVPSV